MTQDPLEPLDPDLADLLAGEKQIPEPPSGARDRVLSRLEISLGIGAGAGPATEASRSAAEPAARVAEASSSAGASGVAGSASVAAVGATSATSSFVVVASFIIGGLVGAGTHAALSPAPSAPSASVQVVREVVTVERVVTVPAAPETSSSAAPVSPGASGSATSAGASASPSSAVARDRMLAEETAMIARAQAALSRGDVEAGRAALAEHQRRFPQGQLSDERAALMARLSAMTSKGATP